MGSATPRTRKVSHDDYVALASFRQTLRGFLHFSAEAAREAGLSPQQHQALLSVKGTEGRCPVTVGELAQRLYVKHHSAVGLVDRLVKKRLLERVASDNDRRKVLVLLTAQGQALIDKLSTAHRAELRRIGPELRHWLETLDHPEE